MNWIYCLYTWSFLPWRLPSFKIGITKEVETRRRQIESELAYTCGHAVSVRRALAVPLLTAGWLEKRLHRAFEGLAAKMPRHAGHTEWFRIRNIGAVVVVVWLSARYNLNLQPWHIVAVFFFPLPLDGALLLMLCAFVEYALFAGIGFCVYTAVVVFKGC